MNDHERSMDKWLKWAAIIGPILGFLFGNCSGAMMAYEAFKNDSTRIANLEGWKTTQDEFNQKTVAAIARLKALMKDVP